MLKKVVCMFLVVLMTFCSLTGCKSFSGKNKEVERMETETENELEASEEKSLFGNLLGSGNSLDGTTPTTEATELQIAGTRVANYPGDIAEEMQWTEKVGDGFTITTDVTVWEISRLTESYAHPKKPECMIEMHEFGDLEVFVFPFEITLTDTSPVKYGGVKYAMEIGIAYLDSNKTFAKNFDSMQREGQEKSFLERGEWFFMVATFVDGKSIPSMSAYIANVAGTVNTTSSICGYVLFVDAKPTPNRPDGATSKDLGVGLSSRPVFGVSRLSFADKSRLQPLLSFTKNKEEFVYDGVYAPAEVDG